MHIHHETPQQAQTTLMRALFDSGASCTLISQHMLPKGVFPLTTDHTVKATTAEGKFHLTHYVYLKDIVLPEFSRT